MDIAIGSWPKEMHSDFEQVKRIGTAKKIKGQDILSLDPEMKEMTIQGSAGEPYQVSLNECTCTDFALRKAPCKHIYRLAMELGLLDSSSLPVYDKKHSDFNPKAEIEKYRSLYLDGKIDGDSYVKLCATLSKIKK